MKLPVLLKSLQPEEYREFEKFLESPFFKVSPQYLKFFRFLCKHHPSFELERADLQAAYRRCFGPQSLNESKLYNLLSGLGKQLEQFLVVRMVLSPETNAGYGLYDQLLVQSLGQRNLGAYFRKEALALIDHTAARPALALDDYLRLQQLHYHVYYNPDTPKHGESPSHLQLAVENLDLYYCIAKLRYAAEMKARERILDVQYALPLLDAILERSAAPGLADTHPLLTVYYHLVKLYRQGVDEPGFRALIAVFTDKFQALTKTDQGTLLRHLINCGISLLACNAEVETELLSLYQMAIETGTLMDGHRITHTSFINIVNLASLCQEFGWAETFITRFSPYLEENKRQPAIDLARAGLYYCQGRLDEAQRRLTPDIFPIPSFDVLTKILLLKIVFDRYLSSHKDYEFLTAQFKSFEKFIRTKPLTAEKKTAQLNWMKYLRKMAVLKFEMVDVSAAKKAALRKNLNQVQPIVQKKWLLEKIDAL